MGASNTAPDATVADMARYPPVIPLPRHNRSGRRPHCSEAKSVPVRPNPVATSSQTKRTPARRHASPTRRTSDAEAHNIPDAPWTRGSSTTAASSAPCASIAAHALAAHPGSAYPGVRITGKHSGSNTALKTPPSPSESEPIVSPW